MQSRKGQQGVPRTEELITTVRFCDSSKMSIDICYQCFGNPLAGNPVVLLVCGLNMQMYAWDEAFCEDLVRAGFFVIRYDNRDIGLSTKIEKCGKVVGPGLLLPKKWASILGERLPYTIEDMAKDGLALLDTLKVPFAHIFGISMGGMIAQCMALVAPSRVMSLVSLMSTTNAPDLPDARMWVKLLMLRKPPKNCTLGELLEFRVDVLCKLLRHALPVDRAYLKQRYLLSLQRSCYTEGLVRQAAALRRCPGRDNALRGLKIPVLVIHGAQDVVVPPIHGYRTASVIPHARMLIFKSMGHYFHPAFFPTIILTFADMASTTAGGGLPLATPTRALLPVRAPDFDLNDLTLGQGDDEDEDTDETEEAHSEDIAQDKTEGFGGGEAPSMSSIGFLFKPFVASMCSPTGLAARASVMVAAPGGMGNPAMPEAVLIDLSDHDEEAQAPTNVACKDNVETAATDKDRDKNMDNDKDKDKDKAMAKEEPVLPEAQAAVTPGKGSLLPPDAVPFEPGSPSTWSRARPPRPSSLFIACENSTIHSADEGLAATENDILNTNRGLSVGVGSCFPGVPAVVYYAQRRERALDDQGKEPTAKEGDKEKVEASLLQPGFEPGADLGGGEEEGELSPVRPALSEEIESTVVSPVLIHAVELMEKMRCRNEPT